jgi:hypothetical protein
MARCNRGHSPAVERQPAVRPPLHQNRPRAQFIMQCDCMPDTPQASLDHFFGLEEEGWRDGQAEGLRGFEVDDLLELHRALHR